MKFMRSIILSACITAGTCLLFLALAAFIIAKAGVLPRGALSLVTTGIACAATFTGGLIPAMAAREKGLYLGLAVGALLVVLIASASYFFYNLPPFTMGSVGKGASLLLSGAIGGILGANRKSKVKF